MMKKSEEGQGLTEYAILLSVVAIASIAVTALFGGALKSKIASLGAAIAGRSASDVDSFEKQAQKQADDAKRAAEHVNGMEIDDQEISPSAQGGSRVRR